MRLEWSAAHTFEHGARRSPGSGTPIPRKGPMMQATRQINGSLSRMAKDSEQIKVDQAFDVIVIGSGAGGLTAAIAAACRGLSVLVIEKTAFIGGTTAISGGGLWIPQNPLMAGLGIADSEHAASAYIEAITAPYRESAKAAAFIRHGPEMIAFLAQNTAVRFNAAPIPDYEPTQPGASAGRTLLTPSFDGRELGADLDLIRPALPQFGVFGGMQIGFEDAAPFLSILRSRASCLYAAGKFFRYLRDRMFHGRATRLVNGNALVARLLFSARARNVSVWRDTKALELTSNREVRVRSGSSSLVLKAGHGVVLATGGYGANSQMRRDNIPLADAGWSLQPEGNEGDGIKLGEKAGGFFIQQNVDNAIFAPMSSMVSDAGERVNFSHIMLDRHRPGFLVVGPDGKRFVNEGCSYQAFGKTMQRLKMRSCWLIATHKAIRRHSMGLAKAAPLPIGRYIRNGYLKKSRSLSGLARQIGVDPITLARTVDRFNGYADAGHDPDFHRGDDLYSASQGDPDHKPNPSLGALRHGPFYAVQLHPGDLSTLNGLATNEFAQVVQEDGTPIEWLYAVGADANSVFRGGYPGGGASLGPTMTFAYIAANHIRLRANEGHAPCRE